MNQIHELESELQTILDQLKTIDLGNGVGDILALTAQKRKLLIAVHQLKWAQRNRAERRHYREEELLTTYKYFQRYGEEIRDGLEYRKTYLAMMESLENLQEHSAGELHILYTIIWEILDSNSFVNVKENLALKICFRMLAEKVAREPESQVLLDQYAILIPLEYPLRHSVIGS
ncbi:hypothetical protein [Chitinophaga sp. Cy-1792]|uniref:hypothetical protein n=1 Tax=Chitinophaga sp. Cy-1792 TaxID=2608339 RepID=UPI0014203D34|nr:hypothetical protein [Chitinophaga sp. Cy-1792]NIG54865.1 hypothetical protein [Chitinophaga sp. Cy-1792]